MPWLAEALNEVKRKSNGVIEGVFTTAALYIVILSEAKDPYPPSMGERRQEPALNEVKGKSKEGKREKVSWRGGD